MHAEAIWAQLKRNMKGTMIREVIGRHPDLMQDLLRIATIQLVIHVMLCAEGSEAFGNHSAVALLLYTCLGVAFYHLISKIVLGDDPARAELIKPQVVDP
jgi:hypothetical protein